MRELTCCKPVPDAATRPIGPRRTLFAKPSPTPFAIAVPQSGQIRTLSDDDFFAHRAIRQNDGSDVETRFVSANEAFNLPLNGLELENFFGAWIDPCFYDVASKKLRGHRRRNEKVFRLVQKKRKAFAVFPASSYIVRP